MRGDGRDANCCIPATHECHRFGARDVLFVEIIWRGVRFAINHHQIRSRFGFMVHIKCVCAPFPHSLHSVCVVSFAVTNDLRSYFGVAEFEFVALFTTFNVEIT